MGAVDNSEHDTRVNEKVTADTHGVTVWVHAVNGGFKVDSTRAVSVYVIGRYFIN